MKKICGMNRQNPAFITCPLKYSAKTNKDNCIPIHLHGRLEMLSSNAHYHKHLWGWGGFLTTPLPKRNL